ncbi:MAG: MBL fold metallo-hydrolase [Clostridia bacterium]|nr:MBL fold metallo-hydrolase [Clostridia bacterium]
MTDYTVLLRGVKKLKQAGVRLEKEHVIYIDPFQLITEPHDADYVLITHAHHDHYSPDDLRRVLKEDTVFVATADVADKLAADFGDKKVHIVAPGDMLSIGAAAVDVLPSYNLGKPFHPRENNWVGYIVRTGDGSYYLPGDCDVTPEFLAADADVFFVPIGGTYTMDLEQAAEAVNQARPKLVIPFHYGDLEGVGVREDGERFLALLKDVEGVVL